MIFLVWFSKVSSKEFQAVSTLTMMGFILFLMGNLMDSNFLKRMNIFSPTVATYWMIAGAIVVISPTFINPNLLSKPIANWAILSIFLTAILIQLITIMIGISILPFFQMWLWISIMIDSGVLIYSITRLIKLTKPPEVLKKGDDDKKELLKIFTKPSRITEEEVAVHKEKKICLVCKGKALGFTFICYQCGAIYCSKCARSLSDLENVCWACDAPLDETKSVKRASKEDPEEIMIPGKGKKEN